MPIEVTEHLVAYQIPPPPAPPPRRVLMRQLTFRDTSTGHTHTIKRQYRQKPPTEPPDEEDRAAAAAWRNGRAQLGRPQTWQDMNEAMAETETRRAALDRDGRPDFGDGRPDFGDDDLDLDTAPENWPREPDGPLWSSLPLDERRRAKLAGFAVAADGDGDGDFLSRPGADTIRDMRETPVHSARIEASPSPAARAEPPLRATDAPGAVGGQFKPKSPFAPRQGPPRHTGPADAR